MGRRLVLRPAGSVSAVAAAAAACEGAQATTPEKRSGHAIPRRGSVLDRIILKITLKTTTYIHNNHPLNMDPGISKLGSHSNYTHTYIHTMKGLAQNGDQLMRKSVS